MEEFVQSFKNKIASRGRRRTVPNSLPTIISGKYTLSGGVQHNQRPSCVSIGPLHRGDPNLQKMEQHKWWLMHILDFESLSIEDLLGCFRGLKDLEERSREAYSAIIDMTSDEFIEMLFLDASFVILRLMVERERQKLPGEEDEEESDDSSEDIPAHISTNITSPTIRSKYWKFPAPLHPTPEFGHWDVMPPDDFHSIEMAASSRYSSYEIRELVTRHRWFDFDELILKEIDVDLITFDNQIPFFIIRYVWKWLVETLHMESSLDLVEHLCLYFQLRNPRSIRGEIHHILHFLHFSIRPRSSRKCKKDGRKYWIPSATELKEAGIEFRLNESPRSFLDIKFEDGVIKIPTICVTERQRLRLQNLVDFEQSVPGIKTHFATFVRFMSCLLSKENDVRIISLRGIIENRLGSDKEVQQFFQNLQQRSSYWHASTFLDDAFIEINKYQQSKRRRWKASFRRKYCNNPWVTFSVMAAIILFVLTFLQTFFTVYSFFHPPTPSS